MRFAAAFIRVCLLSFVPAVVGCGMGVTSADATAPADAAADRSSSDHERDVPPVDGAACDPGLTGCPGSTPGVVRCVSLQTDTLNCGACGRACGAGVFCGSGVCGNPCGFAGIRCGARCIDVQSDPDNCGSCGTVCRAGEVCRRGACALGCTTPSMLCGDRCVDLAHDPANCGSCGHACPASAACFMSACVAACPTGRAFCGSDCVDVTSDAANCGRCGTTCRDGQACVSSACVCRTGYSMCPLSSSTFACAAFATDPTRCGGCNNVCAIGATCTAGTCSCPAGRIVCAEGCVDPSTDPLDCGACGHLCAAGSSCVAGSCTPAPSSWPFDGHDTRHTRFNQAESAGLPVTSDWMATVTTGAVSSAAVDGGRVFFTAAGTATTGNVMVAYDVGTGAELWRFVLTYAAQPSPPAVYGDTVYVVDYGALVSGLWALEVATGHPRWFAPLMDSGLADPIHGSPMVYGGHLYIDNARGMSAYGLDGSLYFPGTLGWTGASPSFWGGWAFLEVTGGIQRFDATTGAYTRALAVPSFAGSIAFDETRGYFIANRMIAFGTTLYAFSPGTGAIAWMRNAGFRDTVGVANGRVFVPTQTGLDVADAATGVHTGGFEAGFPLRSPVITPGAVYVSSATTTYALDAATYAMRWSAPVGGELVVAAGRLFVSSSNGVFHSYRLTP